MRERDIEIERERKREREREEGVIDGTFYGTTAEQQHCSSSPGRATVNK